MIRIKVVGIKAFNQKLHRVDTVALDETKIVAESAKALLVKVRERFLRETDPDGVNWIKSKAALSGQSRIPGGVRVGGTLRDTSALFDSLKITAVDKNIRAIGTSIEYARFHQNSGSRINEKPDSGLPKRIFLGFGMDDVALVRSIVMERIARSTGG